MHRVRNYPGGEGEGKEEDRYSMPFFFSPNEDARVSVVPHLREDVIKLDCGRVARTVKVRFVKEKSKTYNVVVKDSSPMILASPKSASLTSRFLSMRRMFSGLMSRCTILRSCCQP